MNAENEAKIIAALQATDKMAERMKWFQNDISRQAKAFKHINAAFKAKNAKIITYGMRVPVFNQHASLPIPQPLPNISQLGNYKISVLGTIAKNLNTKVFRVKAKISGGFKLNPPLPEITNSDFQNWVSQALKSETVTKAICFISLGGQYLPVLVLVTSAGLLFFLFSKQVYLLLTDPANSYLVNISNWMAECFGLTKTNFSNNYLVKKSHTLLEIIDKRIAAYYNLKRDLHQHNPFS